MSSFSGMDDLLGAVGKLNETARRKIQAGFEREIRHTLEVQQWLRFGLCPCIVQGRYSTCCGIELEPGEDQHG
jgi:hypothetical protein